MSVTWLNALTEEEAVAAFLTCCGSTRWAREMARRRPYRSQADVHEAVVAARRLHHDRALWHGALRYGIHRVRDDVEQHLLQIDAIAAYKHRARS